jgi:hypothetical protein
MGPGLRNAKGTTMKILFENWRKFVNEEASNSKIEDTVVDVLKDEGGAAGLKPIKKAVEDLDLPDGFDLKDFLKGLRGVGQHEDGDYILEDGEEIDVKEGVEIFLEAQEEMLDEKRKRKRKKKKKKKKKKDACYHKVKARYKVWPSAYASGALVKCRKKGAKNWGTGGKKKKRKNESLSLEDIIREEIQNVLDEACWDKYKQVGMKPKGGRMVPNCVPKEGLSKQELEEKKKSSLYNWFKGSKSKDGEPGWVNVVTGDSCASDKEGEGVPKCVSSAKRASMTPAERKASAARKRRKDSGQQQKSGAAKPTYVATDSTKKKKKSKTA